MICSLNRRLMAVLLAGLLASVPRLAVSQDSQPAAPPATGSGSPPEAGAQKARALLDKMIAALGGQLYLDYSSRQEQGRSYMFYQGKPSGVGVEFWYFWQFPDKDRTEVSKKRDIIYIHNGDQGYEITYKGTSPLSDKELQQYLRRRAHSMVVIVRQWLNDPKTLLLEDGPGVADDRMVERVTLINSKNESVTISIDPNSFLPVKKSFNYRDPLDNLKSEEAEVYGNYRLDQGMMTAHTIVYSKNGEMISQRFLTKVEYNVPLQASLFQASAQPAANANKNKH